MKKTAKQIAQEVLTKVSAEPNLELDMKGARTPKIRPGSVTDAAGVAANTAVHGAKKPIAPAKAKTPAPGNSGMLAKK
jgi:hypothetical protein